MKRKKTENFSETLFFKWILNNQACRSLFHLTFDLFDGFDFYQD